MKYLGHTPSSIQLRTTLPLADRAVLEQRRDFLRSLSHPQLTQPGEITIDTHSKHAILHFATEDYEPITNLELTPQRLLRLGSNLCSTLAWLHDRHIIHGHLTPALLFVMSNDRVLIHDLHAPSEDRRYSTTDDDVSAVLEIVQSLLPTSATARPTHSRLSVPRKKQDLHKQLRNILLSKELPDAHTLSEILYSLSRQCGEGDTGPNESTFPPRPTANRFSRTFLAKSPRFLSRKAVLASVIITLSLIIGIRFIPRHPSPSPAMSQSTISVRGTELTLNEQNVILLSTPSTCAHQEILALRIHEGTLWRFHDIDPEAPATAELVTEVPGATNITANSCENVDVTFADREETIAL